MSRIRFTEPYGTIRGGDAVNASPRDAAFHINAGRAELLGADPAVEALLEQPTATDHALPEGFPGREELEAAGYTTTEQVTDAADEDLLAIKGVGRGTLAKIRTYQ